jgi:hypothetical protein
MGCRNFLDKYFEMSLGGAALTEIAAADSAVSAL